MNPRQSNFREEEQDFGMPPSGNRYIGLSGKNSSNYADDPKNIYNKGSKFNNQPNPNEEIAEARQSLMLLKSKMKSKVPQR